MGKFIMLLFHYLHSKTPYRRKRFDEEIQTVMLNFCNVFRGLVSRRMHGGSV